MAAHIHYSAPYGLTMCSVVILWPFRRAMCSCMLTERRSTQWYAVRPSLKFKFLFTTMDGGAIRFVHNNNYCFTASTIDRIAFVCDTIRFRSVLRRHAFSLRSIRTRHGMLNEIIVTVHDAVEAVGHTNASYLLCTFVHPTNVQCAWNRINCCRESIKREKHAWTKALKLCVASQRQRDNSYISAWNSLQRVNMRSASPFVM